MTKPKPFLKPRYTVKDLRCPDGRCNSKSFQLTSRTSQQVSFTVQEEDGVHTISHDDPFDQEINKPSNLTNVRCLACKRTFMIPWSLDHFDEILRHKGEWKTTSESFPLDEIEPPIEPKMDYTEHVTRWELPPGCYFIGDPCQILKRDDPMDRGERADSAWDRFLKIPLDDNTLLLKELTLTLADGRTGALVTVPTENGDGIYKDSEGMEYPVDSGSFGVVSTLLCPTGHVEPFSAGLWNNGNMIVGKSVIAKHTMVVYWFPEEHKFGGLYDGRPWTIDLSEAGNGSEGLNPCQLLDPPSSEGESK